MKKPTKKQRVAIYQDALRQLNDDIVSGSIYVGLCYYITRGARKLILKDMRAPYDDLSAYFYMDSLYPEIFKYQPEGLTPQGYWFDFDEFGTEMRKTILQNAINELL